MAVRGAHHAIRHGRTPVLLVLVTVLATLLATLLAACATTVTASEEPPEEDGVVVENISPYDTEHPAMRNLDPELAGAVRAAADEARADGVELRVTSGWRSRAYQQRLLDEAVVRYGDLTTALRYVSTPDTSKHVTGEAIDIGPTDAADWLIRHGADHGLCQPYANEMWHFELLTAPGGECPAQRADPTA